MDTAAQWPQGFQEAVGLVSKSMEEMVSSTCSRPLMEKKTRPPKEQALNCPRCNSTNTKFCYYNNYSLTQPRYFCKTCRRYWTEGGTLRNVPVGGGTRKKRSSSTSSSSANTKKPQDITALPNPISNPCQNPKIHEVQDLNLGFRATHDYLSIPAGFVDMSSNDHQPHNSACSTAASTSFSDLLRGGGMISTSGLSSFMPMPVLEPSGTGGFASAAFGASDLRHSFNFSFEGLVNGGYGSAGEGLNEGGGGGGKLVFPFDDVKQLPSNTGDFEQHHRDQGHASAGYLNGMLGGHSW